KEQQGKERATLNHSRSPVDDEYTRDKPESTVTGRIDSEQNTYHNQQTCHALQRSPRCHLQKLGFTKQIFRNLVNHPETQNDANHQRGGKGIRIRLASHAKNGTQHEQQNELGNLVKHIGEETRRLPV